MAKEKTHYAVACTKCGHVFNRYTAISRKESDRLRLEDEGEEIKRHDTGLHGMDQSWFETTKIQFKVKVLRSTSEESACA